jgi:hypothetical protein
MTALFLLSGPLSHMFTWYCNGSLFPPVSWLSRVIWGWISEWGICYQKGKTQSNSHFRPLFLETILAEAPLPLLHPKPLQLLYWLCELHHGKMLDVCQYMNPGHPPVNVYSPVKSTYLYQSWLCALITWNSVHFHYYFTTIRDGIYHYHQYCKRWVQ